MKISVAVARFIRHRAGQELRSFVASNNILCTKENAQRVASLNFQKVGREEEISDRDVFSGFLVLMIT